MKPPVIGVTLGDPGGIGPEVTVKALARLKSDPHFPRAFIVLFGPLRIFEWWSRRIRRSLPLVAIPSLDPSFLAKGRIHVMEEGPPTRAGAFFPERGRISKKNGRLAGHALRTAAQAAVAGRIQAIVTAPVHKGAMRLVDSHFSGHTEYLARMSGTKQYAMMFEARGLRVTLVTIHVPLSRVSACLRREDIEAKIRLTHDFLRRFHHIRKPRLAVTALNPHGREFGREEDEKIAPAIRRARRLGIRAEGPFPGDAIFYEAYHGAYDAVIAMYHDQGLAPLKIVGFDHAVNVTLGLPFVRTSPDHGTAFDIAYRNQARETSMLEALKLAIRLSRRD